MRYQIPFNKPFFVGKEMFYIAESILGGHSAGDGPYTIKCQELLEDKFRNPKSLLTHSYTAALDMAALLCETKPMDEVILPPFAYVSLANAFYMRGAKPVFVDIRPDTLNIDETKVEAAVSGRTIAILAAHYGGNACEMGVITQIAEHFGHYVIEDAANSFNKRMGEQYLGTIGDLGVFSFHETSPVMCGEGGALLINNPLFSEKAEIIREKGTNRSKFLRGEVDKYTWVDLGSSFLPSDILAAFLYAQLENMDLIKAKREQIFDDYYAALQPLAEKGHIRLPFRDNSNSQYFYIILNDAETRGKLITHLKKKGILAVCHYTPLHLSPIGKKLGYFNGQFPVTEDIAARILRLPFYYDLSVDQQQCVVNEIATFFKQ